MKHVKVIIRSGGERLKIHVNLTHIGSWKVYFSKYDRAFDKWISWHPTIISLAQAQKEKFSYITHAEILLAKCELWERIKPDVRIQTIINAELF